MICFYRTIKYFRMVAQGTLYWARRLPPPPGKYPPWLVGLQSLSTYKKGPGPSISDRVRILRSFYSQEVKVGMRKRQSHLYMVPFKVYTNSNVLGKFPVVLQFQTFAYKGFKFLGFSDCFVVSEGRRCLKGCILMPKHSNSH